MTWIWEIVLFARLAAGITVTTVPDASRTGGRAACATGEARGPIRRTVAVVTLAALIASLKLTVGRTETATFVAPSTGLAEEIVGAVVSAGARVRNPVVCWKVAARGLPAASFAPEAPPMTWIW